ncbi:uncharacterized protein FFB20_11932 [Fusarium fujikuroi]|nr:uncharacterized protein FFB20_11932 [Fusarium fujikuroi]SCO23781.1 uncharacterized protein FFE2_15755 [Fusarium fujikuroi]SCO26107.1 uncharacterized protein FFC1_15857 [Fusarium fujikuroi]SCO26718.1 uncharacterized protein FFM5_14987 [Fusarium fujikuroi]SCO53717.1 uncharacterized protein FFNC_15145 [Fusarium fujikuroi]
MSKREGDTDKTDKSFLGDSWSMEVFLGRIIHELGDVKWNARDRSEGASFHRRAWSMATEVWHEVINFFDALNNSSDIWPLHMQNVHVLEILTEAANAVTSASELPDPPRKTPPWDVIKELFTLAAKGTEIGVLEEHGLQL